MLFLSVSLLLIGLTEQGWIGFPLHMAAIVYTQNFCVHYIDFFYGLCVIVPKMRICISLREAFPHVLHVHVYVCFLNFIGFEMEILF